MKNIIASLVAMGPAGLFLFAILDGAGLPMPGGVDALLVLLASKDPGYAYQLAAFAMAGSVLGNLILFSIARKGGEMYLNKRSTSASAARFRIWFHHYGLLTVFISALVPLPIMPMKIFVLCSGALESSLLAFIVVFSIARVLRYGALAYLGSQLGVQAGAYLRQHIWYLVLFAGVLFVVLYIAIKIVDRMRGDLTA
jgi:membrane protein YqaA with SNARE-associated domain